MFTPKRMFVALTVFAAGFATVLTFQSAAGQVTDRQSVELSGGLLQLTGRQSPTGETMIQGGGVDHHTFVVLVSPDLSKAWGYSTERGEWVKAPLRAKLAPEFPLIVGHSVGVISEGRFVHAFSSLKGEWQTLELPEGANSLPIVGTDYAQVQTQETISIFSAPKGNWSTVKFAD